MWQVAIMPNATGKFGKHQLQKSNEKLLSKCGGQSYIWVMSKLFMIAQNM